MRKIVASTTGSISTIAIGREVAIWLDVEYDTNPARLIANFIGVAENGVSTYPAISFILLVCVSVVGVFIGLFLYENGNAIFARISNIILNQAAQFLPAQTRVAKIQAAQVRAEQKPVERFQAKHKLAEQRQVVQKQSARKPPAQKRFTGVVKKQLNDWRADANTLKVFSVSSGTVNLKTKNPPIVNIIYYDNRNFAFSERLAAIFKLSEWQVKFNKIAQVSNNPRFNEWVRIKGDNRTLVESIASVLQASGCVRVKLPRANLDLSYYNSITHRSFASGIQIAQDEVTVTVGYDGLELAVAA